MSILGNMAINQKCIPKTVESDEMRKHVIAIIILILFCKSLLAQKVPNDTLSIKFKQIDVVRTSWGLEVGFGISKFTYDIGTKGWLGNHTSPDIKFTLFCENISFGFNFKPWTVNPAKELIAGGDTLSTFADLNPIKIELNIGYNYNLTNTISLQPYIGYLNSSFHVINEDVLKKKFSIASQPGITIGSNINKYLEFKPYQYTVIYLNLNYDFSDYTKIHSSLGKKFYAMEMGVAFKGWFTKTVYR